jgi:hypothetical protein
MRPRSSDCKGMSRQAVLLGEVSSIRGSATPVGDAGENRLEMIPKVSNARVHDVAAHPDYHGRASRFQREQQSEDQ